MTVLNHRRVKCILKDICKTNFDIYANVAETKWSTAFVVFKYSQ